MTEVSGHVAAAVSGAGVLCHQCQVLRRRVIVCLDVIVMLGTPWSWAGAETHQYN